MKQASFQGLDIDRWEEPKNIVFSGLETCQIRALRLLMVEKEV
jgi:hypothetical protein